MKPKDKNMNEWFWYAVGAAALYGLHQVFTKLASSTMSYGLGWAGSWWKAAPP
jgi:hypothetical protein